MKQDELKRIEERAEKATKEPWKVGKWADDRFVARQDGTALWNDNGAIDREEDADFIAHAREDIPALLAYVRELEAKCPLGYAPEICEQVREAIDEWAQKAIDRQKKIEELETKLKSMEDAAYSGAVAESLEDR